MDNKTNNPLNSDEIQPVPPQGTVPVVPNSQQPLSPPKPPSSGIMYEQKEDVKTPEQPSEVPPQLDEEPNIGGKLMGMLKGFPQGLALKIGGAILGIVLLLVVVFRVIIPFFGGHDSNITLTYWGIWEDQKSMSPMFNEFEKTHPNVKIKYEKQDIKSLGKYMDRVTTRIGSGTGPDLFRYHVAWLPSIRSSLAPLPTDVIKSTNIDTEYYDVIKEDLNKNGAYYGIPIGIDTLSLFINTQIFQAAGISEYPTTWDDFIKTARTITVRDQDGHITTAGAAMGTYDNVAHASDIVSLLLIQNGADMYDLSGRKRKNAEDALEFYTSFSKSDNKVWDDTLDNSKLVFAKGSLGMYFGYSWDLFEIKKAAPDLPFIVISVPHVSGVNANRDKTIASYWVEGVSIKSKYQKEAFELMQFMAQKDTLEKTYTVQSKTRLFGEPYPRRDMRSLLKDNKLVFPFIAQADKASSTIFASDTHDEGAISVLNAYLGNAVRSLNESTSPQSAVDTLSQGVNQVLSRYQ